MRDEELEHAIVDQLAESPTRGDLGCRRSSPDHTVDIAVVEEEHRVESRRLVLPHVAVAPHDLTACSTRRQGKTESQQRHDLKVRCVWRSGCSQAATFDEARAERGLVTMLLPTKAW